MAPRILAALLGVVALAGCGGAPRIGGSPNVTVADINSLPPPTGADQIAGSRAYIVGPYDKLAIDVYGVPELSREVQTARVLDRERLVAESDPHNGASGRRSGSVVGGHR